VIDFFKEKTMGKLSMTGTAEFDVEPDTAIIAIRIEQYEYDYARCAEQLNARTAGSAPGAGGFGY
jgi:uncharacterized protein YggE